MKAWVKKLGELKPREVAILNVDPKGAKKAKGAPKSRLTEIATEVTAKTGIPATVIQGESILA